MEENAKLVGMKKDALERLCSSLRSHSSGSFVMAIADTKRRTWARSSLPRRRNQRSSTRSFREMYRRECDCSWAGLLSAFRIDNMRKLHTQALYAHTVHGSVKFANKVTILSAAIKSPALGRASIYFM